MKINYSDLMALEHGVGVYLCDKGYSTTLIECDDYKYGIELDRTGRGDVYTLEEYEEFKNDMETVANIARAINDCTEVIDDGACFFTPEIREKGMTKVYPLMAEGKSIKEIVRVLITA